MESTNIYQESYIALNNLKKSLSQDRVTIDFTKFDTATAGVIKQAIFEAATKRSADVGAVMLNNSNI